MTNKNLQLAKIKKNDEFYTRFEDVQREVDFFLGFNGKMFLDKSVLLPCDDPESSQFAKFFLMNFKKLGLKSLICTAMHKKMVKWQLLEKTDVVKFHDCGKILTVSKDLKNEKIYMKYETLSCDGDFRNEEIKRLWGLVDFIITNPPFSLFREFLEWLIESKKLFLVVGCLNSVSCKKIFPLFKENKIWFGLEFLGNNAFFQIPQKLESDCVKVSFLENGFVKFRNMAWFTNIEHPYRHKRMELKTMSVNLEKFKHKRRAKFLYKTYDNYKAIEVSVLEAIPSDYMGVMGVPVSFLNKFCPEQFEILNANDYRIKQNDGDVYLDSYYDMVARPRINGINIYRRIFIKAVKIL